MVEFTIHLLLTEKIISYRSKIESYWNSLSETFSECLTGMDLTFIPKIEYITDTLAQKALNIPQFISEEYPAEQYKNSFILIFDFMKISGTHLKLDHSIDGSRFLAVPIYDITEEMLEEGSNCIIAILREFYNFIISFSSNPTDKLTEHSESCLRTYSEPLIEESLRPLERIKILTAARYRNVPLELCQTCKKLLCEPLINFLSKTIDATDDISILVPEEKPTQQETVSLNNNSRKGEKIEEEYIPSYLAYSDDIKKQEEKIVAKFQITSEQQTRIKRIFLELGIKEPVNNEFYLEIRERFLKGKLSEHAFRQQAKRLN